MERKKMTQRLTAAAAIAVLTAACGPGSVGGGNVAATNQQVTVQVTGHGAVQLSTGHQCKDKCVVSIANGTRVTVTAEPDGGWTFSRWSGACTGSGACQFNVDRDLELDAAFALVLTGANQHALTIARNGSGTIRSSPAGIDCGSACSAAFDDGTRVALSATPDQGWRFDAWGGVCAGSGDCTIAIKAAATVTATFVAEQPPPPPPPPPPPTDECAGLAPPAPGTPNSFQMVAGTHWTCERPAIDGSGNLAVWMTELFDWPSDDMVFLDAAGTVKGNAKEYPVFASTQLTGQISGFQGLVFPVGQGANTVVIAPDGTLKSSAPAGGILAEDPTGGVMVAFNTLGAYDASGARRFSVQLAHQAIALGVDRTGNALVLSNPGSLHGQWVDHAGKVGPEFDLGVASGTFELYPRIGSGLFLLAARSDGHTAWLYGLDSLATAATPAPDWLASRPDTRLHMAHAGTAYAMLQVPAQGACAQHVEVLAPSGKSCGSAEFGAAPGSCAESIDVGYDGTVVQQLPAGIHAPSCGSAPFDICRSCTWRWWPGFFR